MTGWWTAAWHEDWDVPLVGPGDPPAGDLNTLIREGAQVVSRCDVYLNGVKEDEVPIIDGGVVYSATDAITRNCEVDLVGAAPSTPSDLLSPAGATLQLFRGARDWTGEALLEPLGRYGFEESDVSRGARGRVAISGFDFARYVQDNRWRHPYEITAGTNLAVAIEQALKTRLPAALWRPLNAASTSYTTPAVVWGEERENDPWADLRSLAAAGGMDLYFDRFGTPTLIDVPDPATAQIAWDYTLGIEPTYLDGAKRLIGRPYNVILARGEPADDAPPVEAEAADEDPHSASYVGFYERSYFMTSAYITTEAQAKQAAIGELNRRRGLAEVVTIQSIPHPALDVWQVVRAVDPDLAVDARYVVDRLEMGLRPGGAMRLTTRRRRL